MARAEGSASLVPRNRLFSDDEYRAMETWLDVINALGEENIAFADEELGDGFSPVESKADLIGVPLVFIEWRFVEGDMGQYVFCRIAASFGKDDTRFIALADGSRGIMDQLKTFTTKKGRQAGLVAKRGLRRSDYEVEQIDGRTGEPTGKMIPATTFYIDTTA